jgi:SAM-dependent methyltransferase
MSHIGSNAAPGTLPTANGAPVQTVSPLTFDQPSAREFAGVRALFLDRFVACWTGPPLETALDVGTGVGFFAAHMAERHGLRVTAVDVRASNVAEARRRHRGIEFFVGDVEDPGLVTRGAFDIVTAFGLLYHLENPFRAMRNLAAIARYVLVIESVIAPGRGARAWLLDEFEGEDQAPNYVAWHLTEAGIVKLLYRSGMPHVYRARFRPPHIQFRGSLFHRQARAFVIGSRIQLSSEQFTRISEPTYRLNRAYYQRLPGRTLLRHLLEWRRDGKSPRVGPENSRSSRRSE